MGPIYIYIPYLINKLCSSEFYVDIKNTTQCLNVDEVVRSKIHVFRRPKIFEEE